VESQQPVEELSAFGVFVAPAIAQAVIDGIAVNKTTWA
jgi:hypothetical protein